MGMDPVGTVGGAVSLKNITFVEKLSQTITFAYVQGRNSPRAVRNLNYYLGAGDLYAGSNPYFAMMALGDTPKRLAIRLKESPRCTT